MYLTQSANDLQHFCPVSLFPGYKSRKMSHVRGRLSLKPVHCSNSISRSKRLFSFLLSLVWKFFSSPCTEHDRADWRVRRAASHNAAPVAGKRIQGHGRPETTRHLHHHVTFVDLARMCELRHPAWDTSVRNLEWWSPLGLVYRKMYLFSFHSYLAAYRILSCIVS